MRTHGDADGSSGVRTVGQSHDSIHAEISDQVICPTCPIFKSGKGSLDKAFISLSNMIRDAQENSQWISICVDTKRNLINHMSKMNAMFERGEVDNRDQEIFMVFPYEQLEDLIACCMTMSGDPVMQEIITVGIPCLRYALIFSVLFPHDRVLRDSFLPVLESYQDNSQPQAVRNCVYVLAGVIMARFQEAWGFFVPRGFFEYAAHYLHISPTVQGFCSAIQTLPEELIGPATEILTMIAHTEDLLKQRMAIRGFRTLIERHTHEKIDTSGIAELIPVWLSDHADVEKVRDCLMLLSCMSDVPDVFSMLYPDILLMEGVPALHEHCANALTQHHEAWRKYTSVELVQALLSLIDNDPYASSLAAAVCLSYYAPFGVDEELDVVLLQTFLDHIQEEKDNTVQFMNAIAGILSERMKAEVPQSAEFRSSLADVMTTIFPMQASPDFPQESRDAAAAVLQTVQALLATYED